MLALLGAGIGLATIEPAQAVDNTATAFIGGAFNVVGHTVSGIGGAAGRAVSAAAEQLGNPLQAIQDEIQPAMAAMAARTTSNWLGVPAMRAGKPPSGATRKKSILTTWKRRGRDKVEVKMRAEDRGGRLDVTCLYDDNERQAFLAD